MRHEVEHRRPITIRRRSLLQQFLVGRHRRLLEHLACRERLLELCVNLLQDARQIPSLDILARGRPGLGTLHEAVAVALEVMPVPVGENGVHHRCHLLGRLGDLRLQPQNLFLRQIALDIPLHCNFLTNSLNGLVVVLVLQRPGNDRIQVRDGRLGKALLQGRLVLFPQCFAVRRFQRWGHRQKGDCKGCENE